MLIEYQKYYHFPTWYVTYKDVKYIREYRNDNVYWIISDVGQNRDLYNIQHKLEILFQNNIRKEKLQKINNNESYITK